ncbi:hypothetical protein ACH5RR_008775 [Cinchona calisaya]|uniref:Uncharacterized protein n=1 Tax=Cinchona calisaya TaxID=153742 RepID=A0ABD3AD24_9GENT
MIGQPLKLDAFTASLSRPSIACFCVEVDVPKPLLKRFWICWGEIGFTKEGIQEKLWQPKGLLHRSDTVKSLEKGNPSGPSIMEKNVAPIYVAEKPVVSKSNNALKGKTNFVPNQPLTSNIDGHEHGTTAIEKLMTSLNVEHVAVVAHLIL